MARAQTPRIGDYRLTARRDAPDFRDFPYRPALVRLEPRLDAPDDLHIRDQGSEGACTGFALAAVIDRQLAQGGRGDVRVSARMLYEMARRHDEWAGDDQAGSSCRGAIKGWYNMGVCREQLYPDDAGGDGFSVEAARDARNNTIGAYYRLGSRVSDYHAALTEAGAIFCSAEVHAGWDEVDAGSGGIPFRKGAVGAHAFAIVGYDGNGFWIQNSWGRGWGRNGTALWTYEDWLANVRDAWVFRLALPTPQIWHLPERARGGAPAAEKAASPARAEIAGHFVHVDDGRFRENGRYWSDLQDVKLTADLVAASDDYDHLLFYAHGGLNSPTDSARRIAAMKETFKENRVYPYHFMYDTGLLEELRDVLVGKRRAADRRAGGFTDWLDTMIEKAARVPGRALWREMKQGARSPFEREGGAGTQTLAAFLDAMAASGKPKKLHLAGHSTGMILLCHLLQRLALLAPGRAVATVALMAPAGPIELFDSHLRPLLRAARPHFRVSEMNVYNLEDRLEQADDVAVAYNKSLLYLVARSLEETVPARLLGLQVDSAVIGRRRLARLNFHYSRGPVSAAAVTASETHGGFDNDPRTMNHVLRRILRSTGRKPVREFTRDSLDYSR